MKLLSSLVVSAATLSCLFAAGCAATSEDETSDTSEALGQAIDVPNPSGAYFAKVSANGTGCPAGTWDASISPDGAAFTITFSGYEAQVNPGQSMSIKDCSLSIDLRTPQGFSFSVSSFHYQGMAILDQPGMRASQTAKYYFQGNPLPANEKRSDMVGPYDSSYVFTDNVAIADQVWSPCGAQRRLNAQTRITLQNNPQRSGAGYLNTSSVDGELKMVFGLAWKQCNGGGGSSSGFPGGGSSGNGGSSGFPGGGSSGFPGGGFSCGILQSNGTIYKNQSVSSCDGRTQLTHRSDGQLVLTRDGREIWRNGVNDPSSNVVTMQQDGRLVEWNRSGRQLWYSQAEGGFGAFLLVQDCSATIYEPNGRVLWQAGGGFCF